MIEKRIDYYRQEVERELAKYMELPNTPQQLRLAMSYSLLAGGKRLRPCLLLLACDLLAGDVGKAMPFACAIEMIHTYSLIHDDLPAMDDDDFRRGKPSNHIVFGECDAILAGDGLLTYAFEIMLNACVGYGDQLLGYVKAMATIANGAGVEGMVAGQIVDCKTDHTPNEDELVYIHKNKTAAMLRASVLAGAFVSQANENAIKAFSDFGTAYGLLFQITDDMLDVNGEFSVLGKETGKDVGLNKLTYPLVYGMEKSMDLARESAKQAKMALSCFGESAKSFNMLIDYTLERKE